MYSCKFLLIGKILFLIIISNSSAYEWKEQLSNLTSKYNFPFKNGHMATLQGSCNKPKYKYSEMPGKVHTFKVYQPNIAKKKFKIKGAFLESENGQYKQAPIAYFIPGAFSNLDISQTKRFMHDLGKLGYHVFIFPNPWGTDFIKTKLRKPIGNVEDEAKSIFELLKSAHQIAQEFNISNGQSRLVGVSYGGFISAAVSALNSEQNNPLQLIDTTIISPPIDFSKTLKNLDSLVLRNKETLKLNLYKLYSRYSKICKFENDSNASKETLQIAEGLVIRGGFFDELINSVTKFDSIFELKLVPGRIFRKLSRSYREWRYSFTFKKYFQTYAPDNLRVIESEKGNLYYWKNRAIESGYDNFRFLIAKNDFLNSQEDIEQNEDTIILPTGGHFGFRHLPWFSNFLKDSFNIDDLN
ncbi:hypothetical protein [Halobacteriovorax sp. HLS]|uniref:hypothetical protein n=1 Tax=Halobacteriovorax sp. HLS TaxID=2234000 RepID=UPI000FD98332|nr:hypothetical protein [Halobacteriovorax sp. HLS]